MMNSANAHTAPAVVTRRGLVLPSLHIDANCPPPTFVACPMDEKDQRLPFIIVTPSSPCPESEFQLHFFAPERPSSIGASISSLFRSRSPAIALPPTPTTSYYGSSMAPTSPRMRWLRMFLTLAIPLFIFFHLFLLPNVESHMNDVFSQRHHTEYVDHKTTVDPWISELAGEGLWETEDIAATAIEWEDNSVPTVSIDGSVPTEEAGIPELSPVMADIALPETTDLPETAN